MRWHSQAFLLGAAASVAAVLALASAATAGISGPCSASIAGVGVANSGTGATSQAITVKHDASVPVVMQAPSRLSHVRITMEFAGIPWTVRDKAVTTPVYRDTVPVKDYATYGVGLYKVQGQASGPGVSCSGAALVRVEGNPVTTVAGGTAVGLTVLGVLGVVFGVLGGRAAVRPLRVVLSALAGLIGAIGVLVLLQQAAVLYPTPLVAGIGLAIGVAIGAAAPFLGHRLGHAPPKTKPTGVSGRPAHPAA